MSRSGSVEETPNMTDFTFGGRFNEEWFWVLGYGTVTVIVIVVNTLMLCSIVKNAFLHTNTHRSLALLATRHIIRAMYGLAVVYTSRWTHHQMQVEENPNEVHSTKDKLPLICDIMCTIDVFLLALPMFIMVGLAIHMFTRAPSPNFSPFPVDDDMIGPGLGTNRRKILAPASLEIGLMPKEPIWLSILLPFLPILSAGLISTPIPLLHLSHQLQALPKKYICMATREHLTFDLSVFILTFCLPLLLIIFLTLGLILRRCIHCSLRHCCNSWCKEEFVIVAEFICLIAVNFLNYIPLLEELVKKLWQYETLGEEFWILKLLIDWIPNYVARGAEIASGITLPILCFTFLPAYRKFCNEPDPDDLKLSKPKAGNTSELRDKGEAVLTSVRTKSIDSQLDDFIEEAEHDTKRDYEDL